MKLYSFYVVSSQHSLNTFRLGVRLRVGLADVEDGVGLRDVDQPLQSLADIVDTLVLGLVIRGQFVTELLGGLLPLGPDGEVVHGEGRVPGHVLLHLQERRQLGGNLLVAEGGAGLQEHETLTASVTGRVVDIELVVLVLVQERPPSLEDGQMVVVPVREKVVVVSQ